MITFSESSSNICAALVAAQTSGEWVAVKEHRGEKGAYASLTDIMAAILPKLAEHKLGLVQHFGAIREVKDGQVIGISTRLIHASGEWMEGSGEFPLSEGPTTRDGRRVLNACQAGGAAITYAKRYALAAMLGLPTTDDRDDADRLTLRDAEPLTKDSVPEVREAPAIPENKLGSSTFGAFMDGVWGDSTHRGQSLRSMKPSDLVKLWDEYPDNLPLLGWAADMAETMLAKRRMTWADIEGGADSVWPADLMGCTAQQLRQALTYLRTIQTPDKP